MLLLIKILLIIAQSNNKCNVYASKSTNRFQIYIYSRYQRVQIFKILFTINETCEPKFILICYEAFTIVFTTRNNSVISSSTMTNAEMWSINHGRN